MRIKQVEKMLCINRETVRYYIKEGLLEPRQSENKYRDYTDSDINRLKQILVLRSLGVSIAGIRQLLGGKVDFKSLIGENIKKLYVKQVETAKAIEMCEKIAAADPDTLNEDADKIFDRVVLSKAPNLENVEKSSDMGGRGGVRRNITEKLYLPFICLTSPALSLARIFHFIYLSTYLFKYRLTY